MPLLDLWSASPNAVYTMSLEQIVHIAGDGKLLDNSLASSELRSFFSKISTDKISDLINQSLTKSFQQNGYVLQDLINELGRRLDYDVTDGLYHGKANHIGYDGLWKSPEGNSIVVESKTTDAYRINLDTLASYRSRLIDANRIPQQSSILIIVGREDTGDIEAQIRGSRHAWDIRIISVESLLMLVNLKESATDDDILKKIRGLLTPFEYTRLDNIIDIMFSTAIDATINSESTDHFTGSQPCEQNDCSQADKRDELIHISRNKIITDFNRLNNTSLTAKSKALFWNRDRTTHVACTISKRYNRGSNYWYALHEKWIDFLISVQDGFFILGFTDIEQYISIPISFFKPLIQRLNKTSGTSGSYWHIFVNQNTNGFFLQIPNSTPIDITQYQHTITP